MNKKDIRKTQAILTKISTGIPTFFNIVFFKDVLKLVRECGLNNNNTTKWILTEKGRRLLEFQI